MAKGDSVKKGRGRGRGKKSASKAIKKRAKLNQKVEEEAEEQVEAEEEVHEPSEIVNNHHEEVDLEVDVEEEQPVKDKKPKSAGKKGRGAKAEAYPRCEEHEMEATIYCYECS